MPQRVQAGVFRDRLALLFPFTWLDQAGGDLHRLQALLDYGDAVVDLASAVREREPERGLGAGEIMLPQCRTTIGGSGTVLSPASDFVCPISLSDRRAGARVVRHV